MHLVYNEQTGDFEEALYVGPPQITSFNIANGGDTLFKGDIAHLTWNVVDAEQVILDGEDIPDQIFSHDTECDNTGIRTFELVATNSCGETRKQFNLSVIDKPQFNIQCSKPKLRKGKRETCEIKWEIRFAHEVYLLYKDVKEKIASADALRVSPEETAEYVFEALAIDNKTVFTERITIGVFEEAVVEFKADKMYSYPQIPIVLSWDVKNALKVELDDFGEMPHNGTKIVEPTRNTVYRLYVTDEFGIKPYNVEIRLFPLPQIKSLLVPTPKLVHNLSVTVQQPRIITEVKFPQINIKYANMETPFVPSLLELGLNVQLSPPLHSYSVWSSIKNNFNIIKDKVYGRVYGNEPRTTEQR